MTRPLIALCSHTSRAGPRTRPLELAKADPGIVGDPRSWGLGSVFERLGWILAHPAIVFTAGVLLLAARKPYAIKRPEFANEDGQVFFMGAYLDGVGSIVDPYAGYLHVVPRALALLELGVPIGIAPLVATLVSFAATAFAAAYMLRLPLPRMAALAIAAAILLLPGSRQTLGYVYGIQWYLAMLLVAGAFIRPRWWDYPLLAVVSLSGPFSAMFLPIYLVFARDWRAVIVAGGGIVQGVVYLASGRYASEGALDPWIVVRVLADRAIAERFVGERLVPPDVPLELVGVGVVAVLVLVAVSVGRPSRVAGAVAYVALLTALMGVLFGGNRGDQLIGPGGGGRYFLMASLAMTLAALAGIYSRNRTRQVAGVALAVLLSIGMVRDFHVDLWGPQQGWATLAPACIGASDPCVVPVVPVPDWSIYWPGDGGVYHHNGELGP